MSDAVIYWEPDRGSMRALSLGCLSYWEPTPIVSRADRRTLGGRVYRQHMQTAMAYRIGIEAFAPGSKEREVASLLTHIAAGKAFGIARDSAKAWCGYVAALPSVGATSIRTGGQTWHGQNSATLADGDELVLESLDGTYKAEVLLSDEAVTATEKTINVQSGVLYSHSGVAWLRHRYYLPRVYVPADAVGDILSNQNRRVFTLDLRVEPLLSEVADLAAEAGQWSLGDLSGASSQTAGGARPSLEDRLDDLAFQTRNREGPGL